MNVAADAAATQLAAAAAATASAWPKLAAFAAAGCDREAYDYDAARYSAIAHALTRPPAP